MWDEQFQLFAKGYRVIRFDVRGYGRSSRPTSSFSDCDDLRALLKHLEVQKAHIVGVSNGGRIALDFAVRYPEMADSLVLAGTGVKGYEASGPDEERVWDEFDKQMKGQEDAIKENRLADAAKIDAGLQPRPHPREIDFSTSPLDNSHVQKDNPGKLQVSPEPPAFKRLSEIHAPTLIIIGDRDVPGMRFISDQVHSRIPGSKKLVINGADHIVNMSKPEEFNNALVKFLAE